MKYSPAQVFFWIAAFLILAILPGAVGMAGNLPSGRGFWIEFGALLGFLGLAILNLQCFITGRFRWFGAGFGFDNLLQFHKQMGIFALLLVLAHPAVLIAADPAFLEYFDPRENFLRAVSLTFIALASLVLVASSLWRLTFRLSYERWRLLHGFLSLAILFLGLGHVLMVDHYGEPLWKKGAFILMSGSAMYLIIHSRVVRPWLMRRRPWRIVEVRPQRNDSSTMIIEPEGHEGLDFRAGQFLWITVGDSPYSMQQHPFSIASCPSDRCIELTVKELGDFTESVKHVEAGTRVWLEGPYGCFHRSPGRAKGAVLIAGGVGITPVMSMLRDARHRHDPSPLILFDGNTSREEVMFREEIGEMTEHLNLKVVHVLSEPSDGWDGETGYIDEAVLDRHLPKDREAYEYFICGPGPLLDLVEPILRKKKVPTTAIHTERFDMV
jgi:predicted ferric reductase